MLWKTKFNISKLSDKSKLSIIFYKLQLCLIRALSHYRYRNREIGHLLTLTDSFTWEDLPTRDTETGNITNAGYIPIIQSHTKNIVFFVFVFHGTQSAVRIVMSHELMFPVWFPFDASSSPLYEIVNLIQVSSFILNINIFDICTAGHISGFSIIRVQNV